MAEIHTTNLAETEQAAREFVKKILAEEPSTTATVVALKGDLGAGKTAFVKGVAHALGIAKETVQSPTFVIAKSYELTNEKFDRLYHIDAYRFEDQKEAAVLKLHQVFKNPRHLVFIEWPERIADYIPKGAQVLSFTFINDTSRTISFHEKS